MFNISRLNGGILIESTDGQWSIWFPAGVVFEASGVSLVFMFDRQTKAFKTTDIVQINGAAAPVTTAAIIAKIRTDVLPVSRGQSTKSGSLPVVLASDSDAITAVPKMNSGGHIVVSTHATNGSTFVAFGAQACKQLTIVNNTGVDIEIQQDAGGVALPVLAYSSQPFFGLTNASQLGVRRVDLAASAVNVKARWES